MDRNVGLMRGEYCRMGDRDGKQVLMCSWGKKNEPAVKMDLATATLPSNTENSKIEKSSLEVNDSGAKDYTRPYVHENTRLRL
ncbi:hypothetical protein DPMN_014226 [Dreissena polymorpha]|uniref:Uncharacterized protein n=1 Tax=Dreissena polymorpha TaxID=45954 RepID=A0A9D4NAD1_DREPO|nr:hypothetical protein DPMN_014226 [Dreissena polymorpha]